MPIRPGHIAPALHVPLLGGGEFSLAASRPTHFTMIVFYRGWHCTLCKLYLGELDRNLDKFRERGVEVVAVSADSRERAEKSRQEWGLSNLRVGFDLPIDTAHDWGLFISRSIKDKEPPIFCEPGLFLVRTDGELYYAAIANAPWGRPSIEQLLFGVDNAIERGTPARGDS